MSQLQGGDVGVGLIGDEGGVAIALRVKDLELRAGVGALPAHDQPRALGPGGEIDVLAQLGDPGALAHLASGVDRALPCRLGRLQDRLAHPLVDLVADREADAGVAAILREGVGAPTDVGAYEDLAVEVLGRQLLERHLQHLEVIGGGVGAGVAGPQQAGQRLAGLVEVAEQRVEAEASLVVARRPLLLGGGAEQGGVDAERDRLGPGAGVPGNPACAGPYASNRFQQARVDRLDRPVGCPLGGDRPEERLLVAQHAEVGDAVPAIGDRDDQVAQDDAGIVGGATFSGGRHRRGKPGCESEPISQLDQQASPGMRDDPFGVRPDFYGLARRLCLHLPGVLLGR